MGVPSGANSRPPCASKLCGPVPKYEFPEDGGFSGLISFSAHSLKRILRPLGLGLPCVGWYKAYLETCQKLGPRASSWASTASCFNLFLGVWNSCRSTHPRLCVLCQKCERVQVSTKKNRHLSRKCFFRLQRHREIRCCCCCLAIITQLFVKPCFYNFIYTT